MMSITDSSRAPTPQRGPSTTPLPTFTRRLIFLQAPADQIGPTSTSRSWRMPFPSATSAGTRRLVYDAVAVVSAVRVRPSTSVKSVGASRFEAAMRILYWLPVVRSLMV